MITTLVLAFAPVLLPLHASDDDSDLIVLAGGKEVSCRVLYEDDELVVARSKRKDRLSDKMFPLELTEQDKKELVTFMEEALARAGDAGGNRPAAGVIG